MQGAAGGSPAPGPPDGAAGGRDLAALIATLAADVRACTAAGDPCAEAMACMRLGDALANLQGNLTAGRAWYARAWRLVADLEPCVEQGWVAVAGLGCDAGDPEDLLTRAELALDRARRFADLNLETKALADGGLAHVQAGRVDAGFAMLDEGMALACGPADDDETRAKSACSLFTACWYTAAFDRAETWAAELRRHGLIGSTSGEAAFVSDHCASLQATFLVELGRWREARDLLTGSRAAFERATGGRSFHSALALADLSVREGHLAEAETLLGGWEQTFDGLLPSARLALARGDAELARAMVGRGLRSLGRDRLRVIELLEVEIAAALLAGDPDAAAAALADLRDRAAPVAGVPGIAARVACSAARVDVAAGRPADCIAELEAAGGRLDPERQPWRTAHLHLALARAREAAGDVVGAGADAATAAHLLADRDVVLPPADHDLLTRLGVRGAPGRSSAVTAAADRAVLARSGTAWTARHGGLVVPLRDSKGLRHLVALVERPGAEQHALDLVDRAEGVDPDGAIDRRKLGDAGPLADAAARRTYRHRVEVLRVEIEEALELGGLERAEALQDELDRLVHELAVAFGLGGRSRTAGSAAERARLNVTRSLRTAIARIAEALPEAGAALDRAVRTGTYCTYAPDAGGIAWIVHREPNGRAMD